MATSLRRATDAFEAKVFRAQHRSLERLCSECEAVQLNTANSRVREEVGKAKTIPINALRLYEKSH